MHPLRAANVASSPQVIREMIARAFELRHSDPAGMLHGCELASLAARRTSDIEAQGLAAAFLGNALRVVGRLPEAEAAFEEARATLPSCSAAAQARIIELVANFELHYGRRGNAIAFFEQALQIRNSQLFGEGSATTLLKLAEAYSDNGEHARALETIVLAVERIPQNQPINLAGALLNGVEFLLVSGQPRTALQALDKLSGLLDRVGEPVLFATREHIAGNIHRSTGERTAAEECYRRALALFLSLDLMPKVAAVQGELAALLAV